MTSSRKMRLVYLLLSPTFGMHQYTADLANRFSADFDVHLVTMMKYPEDRYSRAVTRHTPVAISDTGLSLEGIRFQGIKPLKEIITDLNPDLVHITGPHLWNLALVRHMKLLSIPVIHTIHDLDPHQGMRMGELLRFWNRLIMKWVDHILVHGDRYSRQVQKLGVAPDRVTSTPLLHLFLSHDRMMALERRDVEIEYQSFVLFFGRLEKYKGLNILLQAWDAIATLNKGFQYRLILAGPGELPDKWAKKLPPGVSRRDGLILDDEALDLFRGCSLVVLPYSDGTQSALIPAAYYFSKPVVVTRVGALPEYLDDGQTGFVVPPNDPTALMEKLTLFMVDPHLSKKLGETGRKWYDKKRFQETNTIQNLYSLYRRNDLN